MFKDLKSKKIFDANKEFTLIKSDVGVFQVRVIEGHTFIEPSRKVLPCCEIDGYCNVLHGGFFNECVTFLKFVTGTVDVDIAKLKMCDFSLSPTEFTTETWALTLNEYYEFRLTQKIKWSGIEWLNAVHSSTGESICAGMATFKYKNKEVVEDNKVIKIEKNEKSEKYLHSLYVELKNLI
jgi:hypothetical protein